MKKGLPLAERFWSGVDVRGPDECWPWLRGCNQGGYGRIRVEGRLVCCHRVAYELVLGPIPSGMKVLHSCDNPPCCNTAHHWIGTNGDNNADRAAKGRHRSLKGEESPRAKLTEEDVTAIRASSDSQRAIAGAFHICQAHVWRIRHGLVWI